jgi:hypothetical protein
MSVQQFSNDVGSGFGMGTGAELQNLSKALEAGYAASPETQQNGGAFRVESLENSLKVLTYTDQHVKLWKRIPKQNATNTVEEYNQLLSYGSEGGGFIPEGQLPDSEDSQYQRQASFVKFLGTTREVSHQMTLVNSAHGDVISRYNQDGIMWMMKKLEHGLFWGNSKLAPGGKEYVEFDGLDNLIDPQNTIDLQGTHLEEKHINWGSQMIVENYGVPTDLFLPFEVQAQFSQEFFPKERVIMPTTEGYNAGVVVDKFQTHGGPVAFNPNIFLKKTKLMNPQANSPKAPAQPASVAIQDLLSNASTDGRFAGSGAGTYKYYVTACNRHGESAPTAAGADLTLASGDLTKSHNITITNAGTSQFPVDYFRVYRTEADGTNAYEITRIAASSAAASSQTVFNDKNAVMPNTYTAFMGEMSEQILAFKQLAPMMKMDLATLGPAYRWMILLYGVPVLYAPKKWMRFRNIKAELYNNHVM